MVKKVTKKAKNSRNSVSALSIFDDKQFQAEDDLRTLRRADEISVDNSRMKAAKRMADKEMKALNKIRKK